MEIQIIKCYCNVCDQLELFIYNGHVFYGNNCGSEIAVNDMEMI